jgi:transaldolase / glucose-6-phosphate isomerase
MNLNLQDQSIENSAMPVFHLGRLQGKIELKLNMMEQQQHVLRFWSKDPSLWGLAKDNKEIADSMGWLNVVEKMITALPGLWKFESDVHAAGFKHAVLLGMGGSSLSAYVFKSCIGPSENAGIDLLVLDTTDPVTISEVEQKIDLEKTLFIIASKSGSTAEPQALFEYFFDKMKDLKGDDAGRNFVAITDPGTSLFKQAAELEFKHIFLNYEDIGGRYSALSYFGLVPAVLMGINIGELLERTLQMVHECSAGVPVRQNPGFLLGGVIGELAKNERNKLTFFLSSPLKEFGFWLEQLIAESTGKKGTGILPVMGDINFNPAYYDNDRVFVFLDFKSNLNKEMCLKAQALSELGHPVIFVQMDDQLDIGKQFYLWEITTAVAGAVMGINPFDQPDVKLTKDNTTRILNNISAGKEINSEKPVLAANGLQFYYNKLKEAERPEVLLEDFFAQGVPSDYVAFLAYINENNEHTKQLEELKQTVEQGFRLATTFGYGPRYLHSTGQLHKGGANKGLFIQLLCDYETDLKIPERKYGFSRLIHTQAEGDFQALIDQKRRVLKINLGTDVSKGLTELNNLIKEALSVQIKFV